MNNRLKRSLLSRSYDVLELSGGPHDRGYKYGSHYRALLRRLVNSHYSYYANIGAHKGELLRIASKFETYVREYSEDIAEEVRGISDGAEAPLNEIYLIAAFNEIFLHKIYVTCTSFAARRNTTSDGLTYVGQNNDQGVDPWMDGDCVTLSRYLQKAAPNVLIYTYAGAPALMGINSAGLSVCLNGISYDEPRLGVPMLCIAREVLNQKSLDAAIEAIQRAKRAYSLNFMLGTPDGIADVEANPERLQIIRSSDILYHTNHYLRPTEVSVGFESGELHENSLYRCERIKNLLASGRGKLDLRTLQGFLRDHRTEDFQRNDPYSLCCHVNPSRAALPNYRTINSMIYVSEKLEAWITSGNPCENEFIRYSV